MHTKNQTLVIAEYRPFNHESNIFSMTLHHSSVSNVMHPTQLFSPPTHKGGSGLFIQQAGCVCSGWTHHFHLRLKFKLFFQTVGQFQTYVLCIAEEAVCELWKWTGPTGCGKLWPLWSQMWGVCLIQRSLLWLEWHPLQPVETVRPHHHFDVPRTLLHH